MRPSQPRLVLILLRHIVDNSTILNYPSLGGNHMADLWQVELSGKFIKVFSNGFTLEDSRWASIFTEEREALFYANNLGGTVVPFYGW